MNIAIICRSKEFEPIAAFCKEYGIKASHYAPSKVAPIIPKKHDITLYITNERNTEVLLNELGDVIDKIPPQKLWVCHEHNSQRDHLKPLNINRTLCPPSWSNSDLAERILAELFLEMPDGVLHGLVGLSKSMQDLYKVLDKVAKSDASLLITGPTGAGKGHLAKAIAQCAMKDLIKVNMAEVQDNLFESEIFGHADGSFTGSKRNRTGLINAARDNIFFFDEIGELKPAAQAKLLSVIEDKKVRPVGTNSYVDVKARFLFATNRDLKKMVKEGLFREDLFHRLDILSLELPSLKERRVDILILAARLLQKIDPKLSLDSEAKDLLFAASWPGNIRQLDAVLQRVSIFSDDNLDLTTLRKALPADQETSETHVDDLTSYTYKEVQELFKKIYFEQLLAKYSDRQIAIAKSGVSKAQFYNLIKTIGEKGTSPEKTKS